MKKLFVLSLLCSVIVSSHAQKLMHSIGGDVAIVSKPREVVNGYTTNSFTLVQTNLCYFPRYNFIENENSSVSIGAPVSIGVGFATSTYGDDAGLSFAYNLPLVVDYNFGCKSTQENESNFGGYIGAGFGYNHFSVSGSQYSNFSGSAYGPIGRAGIRFGSQKESFNGKAITIGFYYKPDLGTAKWKTYGIHVLVDL